MISSLQGEPRVGKVFETPASAFAIVADRLAGLSRRTLRPLAVIAVFVLLLLLPGRNLIAPEVESDYCYALLAAERLAQGKGLTSLDPTAPFQPWTYRADFVFLTKWPIGYPLLVWLARSIFGGTTLTAATGIAAFFTAVALVGWFCWARRMVSGRGWSMAAGCVAASVSVSVGSLINPRTDTVITGALPWILCLANDCVTSKRRRRIPAFVVLGAVCGALFWMRYASIFVALGIGAVTLLSCVRRQASLRETISFGVACAVPVAALLVINHVWGGDASTIEKLNLGREMSLRPDVLLPLQAWRRLTDFGLYDYRPESKWVCALTPLALGTALLFRFGWNTTLRTLQRPDLLSGLAVTAALVAELVMATALFGAKYEYVSLGRYYEPVRPILAVLCIAGAVTLVRGIPSGSMCSAGAAMNASMRSAWAAGWAARTAVVGVLLLTLHWNVSYAWVRTFERWKRTRQDRTPSATWVQAFAPDPTPLYAWIRQVNTSDKVWFSNFHDVLAWETGAAALPIPPDAAAMDTWLGRAAAFRDVRDTQAVFVLARDNAWRDHYLPPVEAVIRMFALQPLADAPAGEGWGVYGTPRRGE